MQRKKFTNRSGKLPIARGKRAKRAVIEDTDQLEDLRHAEVPDHKRKRS